MPFRHLILPEHNLLFMEYSGAVTWRDQHQLIAAVLADPLHRFDMPKLSLARGITETELDFAGLLPLRDMLGSAYAEIAGPVRWANCAQDDLAFGMARMVQSVLGEIDQIEMEVFRELDGAILFLGLDASAVIPKLGLESSG